MKNEKISLSFTEGSSDKVYQAELKEVDGGFNVTFQYGRRGKPLKSGTKTKTPATYDDAKKIYDKLVLSKTSKGYAPEDSSVEYAETEKAGESTDFKPQLLNPINNENLEELFNNFSRVYMQTKHDGERRGASINNSEIIASNRKGLRVGLQKPIQDALEKLKDGGFIDTEIDSEDMGDHLFIFDVLKFKGEDTKEDPFSKRVTYLEKLEEEIKSKKLDNALKVDSPTIADSLEKVKAFVESAKSNNEEGVVIKNGDATYNEGRPSSGGNALKLKFVESATLRVTSISEGKRSVSIEINDNGNWISVGKCTIPANQDIPNPGELIEVDYLYAIKDGALFQPIYKGKRPDLDETAAVISQLKYKKD